MKKLVCMCASLMIVLGTSAQQKVMFDLFHGQFKDTFVDSTYYDYVIPGYEEIAREGGYQLVMNKSEITAQALDSVDALLILSPLSKTTQTNFTDREKRAITDYIRQGGSVIMFIDEEKHRVDLENMA